jgi:hypothetical protein
MRLALLLVPFALISAAAFAACSSSSSNTGSSGGGGNTDGGTGSSGGDAGASTGGNTGVTCQEPTDCTGGDVCCGTIPITGGTAPNCTSGMITSVCQPPSHCITQLGSTCMGTQTVRICTSNADCAEKGANLCCTFGGDDGGSLTFCANGLIAGFGGGKCM